MSKNMGDLRVKVARRMKEAYDGEVIQDLDESVDLLSIMENGLLEKSHDFWSEYEKKGEFTEDIGPRHEIIVALKTLEKDGHINFTFPFEEDNSTAFVQVRIPNEASNNTLQTSCDNCGSIVSSGLNLVEHRKYYHLRVRIDCDECGNSAEYGRKLTRQ